MTCRIRRDHWSSRFASPSQAYTPMPDSLVDAVADAAAVLENLASVRLVGPQTALAQLVALIRTKSVSAPRTITRIPSGRDSSHSGTVASERLLPPSDSQPGGPFRGCTGSERRPLRKALVVEVTAQSREHPLPHEAPNRSDAHRPWPLHSVRHDRVSATRRKQY